MVKKLLRQIYVIYYFSKMSVVNNRFLKVIQYFIPFLIAIVLFWGGVFVGEKIASERIISGQDVNVITQLENTKTEYRTLDLSTLWEVWDNLNTKYLEKNLDNEILYQSAIKGLVAGLNDQYSSYLTTDELAIVEKSDSGELEGIGVTLRQEDKYTVVESVVDGFPAAKNGIKSGDVILEVNEVSMESLSAGEVATNIRGTAGTTVKLLLYRPSTQKEITLQIIREKIDIDNIAIGETRDGITVIKIYRFTENSIDDFTAMWDYVSDKIATLNPQGLIIDLRGNPGGYVGGVEYILEDFLPNGNTTFSEVDRNGNEIKHIVQRDGRFLRMPLVVLVNSSSASASEIMAGALQDYQRALIVGEKTVGKGVEQQLISLTDGSQLRLVFRKWLTPKGNNINSENPITPDYEIEDYTEQTNKAFELLK